MVDEGFFAAAGGLADMDPVGGLVAGAAMTGSLHEGLEQDGAKAVTLVPVVRQLARDEGEDFRGQALRLDPRQHEEARVVDDERQVALSLRLRKSSLRLRTRWSAVRIRPGAPSIFKYATQQPARKSFGVLTRGVVQRPVRNPLSVEP